jgi:hypothetical protein
MPLAGAPTNLEILPDPWDVPRFRLARFTKPSG